MKLKAIGPPEFVVSLGLLALFAVIVVLALVLDGNRPKALRVGLVAATCLCISGIVRTEISMPAVIVQTLAAALFLGGFHWWAARTWRRALEWIAG